MLEQSLQVALRLAREAGREVLRIYEHGFTVEEKSDGSPITEADRAANEMILRGLRQAFPDDRVLSEESPFDTSVAMGRRLWMVDPLDGTSDFAGRTGDFCVMIGLCIAGRPALGVVYAPAINRLWAGGRGLKPFTERDGQREPIEVRAPGEALDILVSRKHPAPAVKGVLDALPGARPEPRGSVGIKVGLVASGEADVYLHPSPGTHLWDCCAPQAIIEAAGGVFTDAAGRPIEYDPQTTANPNGVCVAGADLHPRILDMAHPHLPEALRKA